MDREIQRILEDLLEELKDGVTYLKGSNRALKEQANTVKSGLVFQKENIKRIKEEIEQRKKSGKSFDDLEQELKQSTSALDKFEKQTEASGKGMVGIGKKIFNAIASPFMAAGKTALGFTDVSRQINSVADAVALGIEDIPGFGKVSMALARDMDTTRELFVQLSQTGASFNGNILALSNAAARASIPLPKFADLIATNSTLLGKFYGTVQAGVSQFTDLGRGLRNMTERDLAGFGLSLDDTSEFLMTFVEAERSRGNLQRFTNEQLIAGTQVYTKQLITLSALTGKSVKELDEQNKAAMADGLMRMKLAGMEKTRADAISLAFGQMSPQMQQFTKELLAFGGPTSKLGFELEAMTGGDMRRAVMSFINTAGDPDAFRTFQNTLGQIGQDVVKSGQPFADLAILTGDFAEAIQITTDGIRQGVEKQDVNGVLERLSTSGQKAVNVLSQFDAIAATLQDVRIQTVFSVLPDVLEGFTSYLSKMTEDEGALGRFRNTVHESAKALRYALGLDEDPTPSNTAVPGGLMDRFNKFLFPEAGKGLFGSGGAGSKQMIDDFSASEMPMFRTGSDGIQNFGSGTPVMLHGREAVATRDQLANLANEILATGTAVSSTGQKELVTNNTTIDNTMGDLTALNTAVNDLIKTNKTMEQHLNMLVTVSAMTEKNTKKTNFNLANLSGSLV